MSVCVDVQLERQGTQHQAGSDSYLTGAAFFKMKQVSVQCITCAVAILCYIVHSWDAYFTRGTYKTPSILVTLGMHISLGSLYSRYFGDYGDAYFSRTPMLLVFWGLQGCIFN